MKKLILIDSHAIIYRAYHALPPMTTPKGEPINAVYGFASILLRIIRELKPDYIVAAFDMAGPTFRHIAYEKYKAQRPEAPDELSSQFSKAEELMHAFSIPVFQKESFEADDIIGTIVKKMEKNKDVEIMIVTGDMDALQLVGPKVKVYSMKKGVSETVTYNEAAVKERYGLTPQQLIDFKGLKGDPSDNISGVRGIGEKTATDLLKKFDSIEGVYKALKKDPGKFSVVLADKLRAGEEDAQISRELARIKNDVPIDFDLNKSKITESKQGVIEIFNRFGFTSLLRRLGEAQTGKVIYKPKGMQASLLTPSVSVAPPELVVEIKPDIKTTLSPFLLKEVEEPLAPILRKMERKGILLDLNFLKKLSQKIGQKIGQTQKDIYKIAGEEFNINSTRELSRILFEKLKISTEGLRRTEKGGVVSTSASELEKLKDQHEIIHKILKYRELAKLKNTYIDTLPKLASKKDGRIHTTYDQFGTATGRLSSSNPNLQNIPIISEEGREIRKAFISQNGYELISFDYSQIELRVAAHLADDKKMIEAFRKGEDIHSLTASEVYNIPLDKVTPDLRRAAKTLNFGVLYGMGSQAFSESTGLSRSDAKKFIDEYFRNFSGIKHYIEDTKKFARENGYVQTLYGRIRQIPEINSASWRIKREAERMAVNMPIQGCLPAQTRILTSKGYISIGELYKLSKGARPRYVWDGSSWKNYSVLNRGKAELAQIKFTNGQILNCDTRHILLVTDEQGYKWKRFGDLDKGDKVCLSFPKPHKFETPRSVQFKYKPSVTNGLSLSIQKLDEDFWYWMGYFYGDGWLSRRIIVHKNNYERLILNYVFGHQERDKLSECKNYFERMGLRPRIRKLKPVKKTQHNRFILIIESRGLGKFLKQIGISAGTRANTKRLPIRIYGETLCNRKIFIKGLLDSDGWYGRNSRDQVTIHLCQRELLEDTNLLLKTIGIPSRIHGPYFYKEQVSYRLDIPRSFIFEHIFDLPPQKMVRIGLNSPRFLIRKLVHSYPNLPKNLFMNNSDYIEYRRWHNGGTCSIYYFKKFIDRYGLKIDLPLYDMVEVASKLSLNKRDTTYTLSVEKTHRFDSEGVISKNTATGDIVKIAMVKADKWIRENKLEDKVRMLLQVHDELVFEIEKGFVKKITPIIKNLMESAAKLKVPIVVEVKAGRSWGEQRGLAV